MQQVKFNGENSTIEYFIEFKLNMYIKENALIQFWWIITSHESP
jgi:hypothetical protein